MTADKVGFLRDDDGRKSLMRLLALYSAIIGSVMILWALITWAVVLRMAWPTDHIGTIIGVGAGLAGGGTGLKYLQKRVEVNGGVK